MRGVRQHAAGPPAPSKRTCGVNVSTSAPSAFQSTTAVPCFSLLVDRVECTLPGHHSESYRSAGGKLEGRVCVWSERWDTWLIADCRAIFCFSQRLILCSALAAPSQACAEACSSQLHCVILLDHVRQLSDSIRPCFTSSTYTGVSQHRAMTETISAWRKHKPGLRTTCLL